MPEDFDLEIKTRLQDEADRRTEDERKKNVRELRADRNRIDEEFAVAEEANEVEEAPAEDSDAMKAIKSPDLEVDAAGNEIKRGGNALRNLGMSINGGVRDSVANTINGLYDLAELAGAPEWDVNDTALGKMTRVARREGLLNDLTRGGAQFVAGFMGAGVIFKAISKTAKGVSILDKLINNPVTQGGGQYAKYGRDMARASVADVFVFDPKEGRLADIVPRDSKLDALVPNYLRSEEDDSNWEGRIKNGVEGIGLGLAFPVVWRGLKMIKRSKQARGAMTEHGVPIEIADQVDNVTTGAINSRQKLEALGGVVDYTKAKMQGPLTPEQSARDEARAWAARGGKERRVNDRFATADEQAQTELRSGNDRREAARPDSGPDRRQERPAFFDEPQAKGAGPLMGVHELTEIAERRAIEARPLSPEARAHIDAAELKGMDIEEHLAPFEEAARAENPIEVIRRESPEEADALMAAGEGTREAHAEATERVLAEVAESELALAKMQQSAMYQNLPKEAKVDLDGYMPKGFEKEFMQIRKNVDETVQAEKADVLPNDHTALDEAAALREAEEAANMEMIRNNLDGKAELNMDLFEETAKARSRARAQAKVQTLTKAEADEYGKYGLGSKQNRDTVIAIGKIASRPGDLDVEDVARAMVAGNLNRKYLAGSEWSKDLDELIHYAIVKNQDLKQTRSLQSMTAGLNRSIDATNKNLGVPGADRDAIREALIKGTGTTANQVEAAILGLGKARALSDYYRHGTKHLANKLRDGTLNELDLGEFLKFHLESIQVQKSLHRISAGTGRLLKSHQQHMASFDSYKFDADFFSGAGKPNAQLEQLINDHGGRDAVTEMLRDLGRFTHNGAAWDQAVGRRGSTGSVVQGVQEVWYNGMLSGPLTAVVNFGTTYAMIPNRVFEQIGHGLWDIARHQDSARLQAGFRSLKLLTKDFADMVRMSGPEGAESLKLLTAKHMGKADFGDQVKEATKRWNQPGGKPRPVLQTILTGESATTPGRLAYDISQGSGKAVSGRNVEGIINKGLGAVGSSKRVNSQGTWWGRMMDVVGHVVGLPISSLNMVDESAKVLQKRGFLREEIFMHLHRKGFRQAELDDAIDVLMTEVTHRDRDALPEEIFELFDGWNTRAESSAARNTFTNDLGRGGITAGFGDRDGLFKSILDLTNKHPSLKFLATFMRTTTNLASTGMERTPGLHLATSRYAMLKKQVADGVKAGKPDLAAKADLEGIHVRAVMGTAVLTGVYGLAEKGMLTGSGPNEHGEREALMATGWKPEALVITDAGGNKRYIQHKRLDPISAWITIVTNVSEAIGHADVNGKEWQELTSGLMWGTIEILRSKSVMTNITSFLDAMADPDHKLEYWRSQMGSSFVPSGIKWAAHHNIPGSNTTVFGVEADTILRETNGLLDAIKNRLPGYNATLPPRRNFFGEFVQYPIGYGVATLSPLFTSVVPNSIVNKEVHRLTIDHAFSVSMNAYDKITEMYTLDGHDRDRLIVITSQVKGVSTREALTKLMRSPAYKMADDSKFGKQELIHNLLNERVAEGKRLFLIERPDINEEVQRLKAERKASKRRLASKELEEEGTTQGNIKTITASLGLTPGR